MIIKTLSAAFIVTVALSAPVLANDTDVQGSHSQKAVHTIRHYGSTYNQVQDPEFVMPRGPVGNYLGSESFDRSRVGSHDPDFNPSGS